MALQLPWPSQQATVGPQVWPNSAQPVPPPAPPVPPPLPPAPLPALQVPLIEPGVTAQRMPVQQSAVVVQEPPPITQAEPQRKWPVASGTQGASLQQSCAEAQAPPAVTHAAIALQRGTPFPSSLQQSFPEVHAQQSLRVEFTEQPPFPL